jgi:hypothetical protein
MVNVVSRTWLIGGWMAMLALAVTVSRSMDAGHSTTVLLAALAVAPGVVIALLTRGVAAPTTAGILRGVQAKEGRP